MSLAIGLNLNGMEAKIPWQPKDATRFTKKANTPSKKRQFSHVADSALARGMPDKEAIIEANAVVKRNKGDKK